MEVKQLDLVRLSTGGGGERGENRALSKADRPLSPTEVAIELNKSIVSGSTRKELKEMINIDASMISNFLKLLKLPPSIRSFVNWGGSNSGGAGFTVAWHLTLCKKEHHEYLFEQICRWKIGKAELNSIRQLEERSSSSIEESVERVLKRRPSGVEKEMWIGKVPENLTTALSQILQWQRDAILKKALAQMDLKDISGKLADKTISLIGGHDLKSSIMKKGFKEKLFVFIKKGIEGQCDA